MNVRGEIPATPRHFMRFAMVVLAGRDPGRLVEDPGCRCGVADQMSSGFLIRGAHSLGPRGIDMKYSGGVDGSDDHRGRDPVAGFRLDRDRPSPAGPILDCAEVAVELHCVEAADLGCAGDQEVERVVGVRTPRAGWLCELTLERLDVGTSCLKVGRRRDTDDLAVLSILGPRVGDVSGVVRRVVKQAGMASAVACCSIDFLTSTQRSCMRARRSWCRPGRPSRPRCCTFDARSSSGRTGWPPRTSRGSPD